MYKKEIRAAVIGVVREIQEMSGRELTSVTPETRPVGDLPGFDSLNGIEGTIMLSERLGISIPLDVNVFLNEQGDRVLAVEEICERVVCIARECENANAS